MKRSATALGALTALALLALSLLALTSAALADPPSRDPALPPGSLAPQPSASEPPASEPPASEPPASEPPAPDPGVSTEPAAASDPTASDPTASDPTAPDAMTSVEPTPLADPILGPGARALNAAAPDPPQAPPASAARPLRRTRPFAMTGIRIFGEDGRCLDVHGGQPTTGAPVVLAACHGRADQRWSFTPGGRIRGGGGHCVAVTGRSRTDASLLPGADVVMARCDGQQDDQAFERGPGGELRVHGDHCLSLDHPAHPARVRVEVRPCDGAPDQRWFLGTPPAPSAFRIADGDGRCPVGYAPLPVDEATATAETLCPLLGQWHIARLADGGSMDGPGYGCGVRVSDARPLGHTLCRPGRGRPR